MKKLVCLILVFCFTGLHAQTDKPYLIRAHVGYNYIHKDRLDAANGFPSNGIFGRIEHKFTGSASAGRKLNPNFYYGLGFSYQLFRSEFNPEQDVPDPGDSSGYTIIITSYENTVTTENTYSPYIYFQYFYNVSEIFSFTVDLYSKYDFSEAEIHSDYIDNMLQDSNNYIIAQYYKESKQQYLNFGLRPALRINIGKNCGMEFCFGQVEFRQKTWESRLPEDYDYKLTSGFAFEFKPEDWMVGFYLKL